MAQWTQLETVRHQVAIAGRVSNAETGQVIQGALVELSKVPDRFKTQLALKALQSGDRWQTLPNRPDRTYSAIDGSFYFIDLPATPPFPNNYELTVSLPAAGTRYGVVERIPVTVSYQNDQIERATVAVALPPTAVKGQIRDGDQQPIVMATVQLSGSHESAFSDDKGNYLLQALEVSPSGPEQRTVTVSASGCEPTARPVRLVCGKTASLNVELKRKQTTQ